ncbi:MAG: hypothetical protein RJA10_980, partial [Pseudomonadota bacterium]
AAMNGSQPDNSPAPRLALVLGSGGVRSVAALGLFEVLARQGLKPDLVVGCSAGAMFGALVAMGHEPQEAIRVATTLWSPEVARQRRWKAVAQMLWPRLGGFDADFALRDDRLIMQRLAQAFGDAQIEALPTALRIAATNAGTGEGVVLKQGSLVQALRASIAVPFMFKPIHVGGERLIDGFVADPLPVSAAADAQVVIALGFESPMPRKVDGPSRMLAQLTSALTNNLMQARLAAASAGGAKLLTLVPRLQRRVGLFDTEAMPYLVDEGRRVAEEALPAIHALARAAPPRLAVAAQCA